LGKYWLDNSLFLVPPLSEQRAIAAFLDRETGRIDTLIEKKERQVELLQEKRAALISHAVTKGLDPDIKMKDLGVEWLGEIPEHWEMLALKRLAILKSGESITAESIDKDGDYPVFGGNGLRGYTTTFTHNGNYVLIGRQGALCGNINYAQGQFWASEHAVVVSPIGPVETKWLGELLSAMNLNQYSVSAAQPGLSVETVSNLSIPKPPLQEQSIIAAFLDRETAHIDTLTTKIRESILKLREYRTALISAAVTGKIDVREGV
jgi:type I restriction enzyme S subunit